MGFMDKIKGTFVDDIFMWPADVFWGGKENDPILGGMYDDPQQQAMVDAMRDAERRYEAYRPAVADARVDALNQTMDLFQVPNSMLGQMYGQGAMTDLSMENPMDGVFAADKKAKEG